MLVSLLGAGSFDFTAPLLRVLLPVAQRQGLTIGLCDQDAAALDDLETIVGRLNELLGTSVATTRFTSLEPAAAAADFVVVTLNYGGLRADIDDFAAAVTHGFIPKHVDTIGPAGWLRALRMGAMMRRVLDAMRPGATLLNLSNPLSLMIRMAARRGVRAVGFCHGPFNRASMYGGWLGLDRPPHLDVWGTNHLSWITEFSQDGEDLLPALLEAMRVVPDRLAWRYNLELYGDLGVTPVLELQHMADFFGGFNELSQLKAYGVHPWDGPRRWPGVFARARRRQALARGDEPIDSLRPSAEGVEKVIDALLGGPAEHSLYNVPLPSPANGLPAGATVESYLTIDSTAMVLDPAPVLPEAVGEQLERVARQQDLAAQACLEDELDHLVAALELEPNVGAGPAARVMVSEAIRMREELFRPAWRAWAAS